MRIALLLCTMLVLPVIAQEEGEEDGGGEEGGEEGGGGGEPCAGGEVDHDFLDRIKEAECDEIKGSLIMRRLDLDRESLEPLQRVKKVEGQVIFEDNVGFEDLSFLSGLEEIINDSEEPALKISNNRGLTSLGMPNLESVVSAGEGPSVEIYSKEALPEDVEEMLKSVSGERYKFVLADKEEVEEETASNLSILTIVMIASGIVVLLVIAAVIGIVFTKKAQKKKLDETAVKRMAGGSVEGESVESNIPAYRVPSESRNRFAGSSQLKFAVNKKAVRETFRREHNALRIDVANGILFPYGPAENVYRLASNKYLEAVAQIDLNNNTSIDLELGRNYYKSTTLKKP